MEEGVVWNSSSATKTHSVKGHHLWTIHDFENTARSTKLDKRLTSDRFSVERDTAKGDRETLHFQLVAYLNGISDRDNAAYIAIYINTALNSSQGLASAVDAASSHDLVIRYKFHLVRKDGTDWQKKGPYNSTFTERNPLWGLEKGFSKEEITRNAAVLLPDGKLTIGCWYEIVCDCPQEAARARRSLDLASQDGGDSLSHSFSELLSSGDLSDVDLVCGEKTFPCHTLVLSARSDVFRAMFSHRDTRETQSGRVEILDSEPEAVERLISFVYTGECEDLDSCAASLLPLADKYNVSRLVVKCEASLASGLKIGTAAQTLRLAYLHGSENLMEVALDFAAQHMSAVSASKDWGDIKKNHPEILSRLLETMSAPGCRRAASASPEEGASASGSSSASASRHLRAKSPACKWGPAGPSKKRRRNR